jgi:NAD+ kinase
MKAHFVGSKKPAAQRAIAELVGKYGQADIADAAVICAVGGDGTALSALHAARRFQGRPVFAMRLPDSVGALGNTFELANLDDRLRKARRISVRPLLVEATTVEGDTLRCFAFNEIVLSRAHLQAARLCVRTAGGGPWTERRLIGDGLLVSTALGSGGYNLAAGGPLLFWTSGLLALTGIAVRPSSEWRNTVVDERAVVEVEIIDPQYRPVRLETDFEEVPRISRVQIASDQGTPLTLLVD